MEVAILKNALPKTVPVPIYNAMNIGTISKNNENFSLYLGLNRDMVQQLQAYSLDKSDTELDQNTSDRKRFGEGSYEEWYSKQRVPFALVDENGTLAALSWYGPKPLGRKSLKYLSEKELQEESTVESGEWHTVAFRSYPPYRGKGLMTGFTKATSDIYEQYFPNIKLSAGVSRKNPASMALASRLGFKVHEEASDENWVAMVKV